MKPRYEQPAASAGSTFTCFVRREPGFGFSWHHHREYELTLITAGSGSRYVGTAVEHYQPGDLILLGPDLPHTFASAPGPGNGTSEAVVTQFRHEFAGPGLFGLPQFGLLAGLLARSARGLRFGPAPAEIGELVTAMPGLGPAAATVTLLDVLRRLAEGPAPQPMTGPGYTPAPGSLMSDRIDAVCGYLQAAHTEPVRLADVAALAHLSPTSFSRFFRQAMGRTLTDYVNQLRVETACSLLAETALPVTQVASASGYRNLANFNRRFRERKGMRPTEYRTARRGRTCHAGVPAVR